MTLPLASLDVDAPDFRAGVGVDRAAHDGVVERRQAGRAGDRPGGAATPTTVVFELTMSPAVTVPATSGTLRLAIFASSTAEFLILALVILRVDDERARASPGVGRKES
jgi:hypothetical protein